MTKTGRARVVEKRDRENKKKNENKNKHQTQPVPIQYASVKKANRKVQEEPQAEAAASPRHQEEEKR